MTNNIPFLNFSFLLLLRCIGGRSVISSTTEFSTYQQFTLGLVLSTPGIDDGKMQELIGEAQSSWAAYFENLSSQNVSVSQRLDQLASLPMRLQVNPVHTQGLGLDKIINKLFCSPESKGTNAVFFLVDQANQHNAPLLSNFMATLSGYAGLPAIAWTSSVIEMEQISSDFPMLLLAPSVRSQARAIFQILRRFLPKRKVSILISPKARGSEHFIDELRQLSDQEETPGGRYSRFQFDSHQHHMSKRFVEVIQFDNATLDNLRKEMVYLRDTVGSRVFLLYSDVVVTDRIMEEAHILGMTTSEYVWICGKLAYTDVIPQNYLPGMLVVTYNTSVAYQTLALKAAIRVWSEAVRRLVTMTKQGEVLMPVVSCTRFTAPRWNLGSLFHRLLRQRLIRVMSVHSDVYAALNDISVLSLRMNRQWRQVGQWTTSRGLIMKDEQWFSRLLGKEIGMIGKGDIIRVATLDEPPYVAYELPPGKGPCPKNSVVCRLSSALGDNKRTVEEDSHTHHVISSAGGLDDEDEERPHVDNVNVTYVCCVGFAIDLFRKLSTDIGFDFEMFEVADRKWGAYDASTRKWNGLVQALLEGSADMVATSLKINKERNSVIDFSVPFYETGVTILVRVRDGLVPSVAFLQPFSPEVWLIVFLGCVNACALFNFIFENVLKFSNRDDLTNDVSTSSRTGEKTKTSLFGSYWLVFSMLFNAAMKASAPQGMSGRFLANVWAFFCVIFMSSFMANLAAFMITKEEYYDFTGLDDFRLKNPFTKNPPWKFSTIAHGATEQLIKANDPVMYEYMRRYTQQDVEEGVKAIKSGELDAFIYDASVLSYKAGRDKNCILRTVGKWYAPTGYGIGLPKTSKWLHLINKHLIDYQVSGYLQHLEDYWLSSSCKARYNQQSGHRSAELGIANFQSAFGLLGIAICCCGIFLALENICAGMCRARFHRNQKFRLINLISPSLGRTLSLRRSRRASSFKKKSFSQHQNSGHSRKSSKRQLLRAEPQSKFSPIKKRDLVVTENEYRLTTFRDLENNDNSKDRLSISQNITNDNKLNNSNNNNNNNINPNNNNLNINNNNNGDSSKKSSISRNTAADEQPLAVPLAQFDSTSDGGSCCTSVDVKLFELESIVI